MNKTKTVVDLFCGASGTTTGFSRALKQRGYTPKVIGVNHWPTAIETSKFNHPEGTYYCANLEHTRPLDLVPSGYADYLVASPECTHFADARGARPMSDQSRSNARIVTRWCDELYIPVILIENVREFEGWGPLNSKRRPIPHLKGTLFRHFIKELELLGYHTEYRILDAADFGAATSRKRLFLLGRRGKYKTIVWPVPTHAENPEKYAAPENQPPLIPPPAPRKKWRAAAEIIDWSLSAKSIFDRDKPLVPNTLLRIFSGLVKFSGISFVFANELRDEGTNSQGGDPFLCAVLPEHPLSNMDAFVIATRDGQGNGTPRKASKPLKTVLPNSQITVIRPFVLNVRGGNDRYLRGESVDKPMQSITTSPALALVDTEAMLLGQQSGATARPVSKPTPTIAAAGAIGLIQPQAFITSSEHSKRNPSQSVFDITEPMPVITTTDGFGLAEPVIVSYHGGEAGKTRAHSIHRPLPSPDTSNRFGLVDPILIQYNGNSRNGQSVHKPLNTLTTKEKFALIEPVVNWIVEAQGKGQKIVGIPIVSGGEIIGLLDICYRMLVTHECAAAMGFPKEHKFFGTRKDVMKQIGNAVEVTIAEKLAGVLIDKEMPASN